MSEFRVLFSTDNAAFEDGRDFEIARILRKVADEIEASEWTGVARDVNGNRVGDYGLRIDGSMP